MIPIFSKGFCPDCGFLYYEGKNEIFCLGCPVTESDCSELEQVQRLWDELRDRKNHRLQLLPRPQV